MWEHILEAFLESLIAFPILFLVYLLIEYLEHKKEIKFENMVAKSKKTGPLFGAAIGIIPQCAFSSIMSDLYSKRLITIGTLFSVFIATSDEAIAIILSSSAGWKVFPLILTKLIISIIFGYVIDFIFKKQKLSYLKIDHNYNKHKHEHEHHKKEKTVKNISKQNNLIANETLENKENSLNECEICEHNKLHHHHEICDESCGHSKADGIFKHAFIHSVKIFSYILIANILLSLIIHLAGGTEVLYNLFGKNAWYTPILTSLIGLIPNCASSVVLVELYLENIITFASCVAGLSAGAGVGLIILFKRNKNLKQNILITLSLYAISVLVGFILNLIPFLNF